MARVSHNVYRKLAIILLFVSFCALVCTAQQIDVSGTWQGNSYYLKTQITTIYELTQEGQSISGYAYTKHVNDSSKAKVQGSIKGNRISLLGTEFIYNVGTACLSQIDLFYSQQNSFESLSGKWRGTLSFKTCVPGVSGRVELFKSQSSETPEITQEKIVQRSTTIAKEDFEGNELAKALSQRDYYALIIAVNDYEDDGIQDLDNPIQDANNLTNTLENYYTFESDNIYKLTNPTRSEIIEAFDKLANKIEERDNLLIFYAGHGIWDEKLKQGFWLPTNAKLNSKAQWISNSTLRDYVSGIDSKHTLLITDACFSGSIFKKRAVFGNSKAILEMYKLPSRKAMTSGALKTVPDKSVFLRYLNKNLISNQEPLLSAEQLFNTFKVAVINNSPNGQVPQYGPIGQAGDEGGDFIFLKRQ